MHAHPHKKRNASRRQRGSRHCRALALQLRQRTAGVGAIYKHQTQVRRRVRGLRREQSADLGQSQREVTVTDGCATRGITGASDYLKRFTHLGHHKRKVAKFRANDAPARWSVRLLHTTGGTDRHEQLREGVKTRLAPTGLEAKVIILEEFLGTLGRQVLELVAQALEELRNDKPGPHPVQLGLEPRRQEGDAHV